MGSTVKYDKSLLEYDLLFKLLIIGDAGVGKSCLVFRYSDDVFSESYCGTIGVDFKVRTVEMDGKVIKLKMWDTAGQERFRTITHTYFRGANGVIFVFDLTDMESFENLPRWFTYVDKCADTRVAKMLVGTKSDMEDKRVISYEMGQEFADQIGIPYMETSAKNSTNVEQTFMTMTAEMKKVHYSGALKMPQKQILLDKGHEVGQKWSPLSNMCNC